MKLPRWILLPLVILIAAASLCCSRQPPSEQQLPPLLPDRWAAVADLGDYGWLIADRRPDLRAYYIKRGEEVNVIIGAAEKPVLHHSAQGKLYFTCWGGGDSLFIDFPVMRIYDLQTGALETQQLFFRPGESIDFGDPTLTPGNELCRIDFTRDGLEVGFATAPGAGDEAFAGAGLTIPWTRIAYKQGLLVVSFQVTTVAPGLRVPTAPPSSLLGNIRVTREDSLNTTRLDMRLPPWTVYRASCGSGERKRVLSLHLRLESPVRLGGAKED